jgi:4-hydroxy-4-methyl-2-oxoglutarate aldolase
LEHGAVNVPVVCAGAIVESGDIVIGDDDGVVVVPKRIATEVVTAATAYLEGEKAARGPLAQEYVPVGVAEELKRHGYTFI